MRKLAIRCDCNSHSGFGHFSRCLNLARSIRQTDPGCEINFIGDFNPFSIGLLAKYKLEFISSPSFSHLNARDFKTNYLKNYDLLILDSYLYDRHFLDELVEETFGLIIIDDYNDFDFSGVDLIINFNILAEKENYNAKKVALGTCHFIYKPEFRAIREINITRNSGPVEEILLFFSGQSGNRDTILPVITALDNNFSQGKITLIHPDESFFSSGKPPVNNNFFQVIKPTSEVEKCLARADLVIGGGGMFNFESSYAGVPNIIFALNEEIDRVAFNAHESGVCFNGGPLNMFDIATGGEFLKTIIESESLRNDIIRNCAIAFDTDSNNKLAKMILDI